MDIILGWNLYFRIIYSIKNRRKGISRYMFNSRFMLDRSILIPCLSFEARMLFSARFSACELVMAQKCHKKNNDTYFYCKLFLL